MVLRVLVEPELFADADTLGAAAASLVADRIAGHPAGSSFLLGCPGGRSALTTFGHLADLVTADRLDLSRVVIVMMDEYVVDGPDGARVAVGPAAAHSCRRFGREEILGRLNAGLPTGHRIRPVNLWVPDPAAPDRHERRIVAAGGVAVFLLASGAGDGHIAFNSPGADRASRTRLVDLPDTTRRDNLATFPSFGGYLAAVPPYGVTVGIATIADTSAEAVMLVHGADKRTVADRLRSAQTYDPSWPATIVTECRHPHLFVDRAACPDLLTVST